MKAHWYLAGIEHENFSGDNGIHTPASWLRDLKCKGVPVLK
jgi:hypothetical protein